MIPSFLPQISQMRNCVGDGRSGEIRTPDPLVPNQRIEKRNPRFPPFLVASETVSFRFVPAAFFCFRGEFVAVSIRSLLPGCTIGDAESSGFATSFRSTESMVSFRLKIGVMMTINFFNDFFGR